MNLIFFPVFISLPHIFFFMKFLVKNFACFYGVVCLLITELYGFLYYLTTNPLSDICIVNISLSVQFIFSFS